MHHDLNLLAIVVAAIAAVVLSTVYYMALGRQMAALHPAYADPGARPAPWKVGVELLRSFVLAHVVALIAHWTDTDSVATAVHLALLLWVGFPLVLWIGAMVWERVPGKLALIHLGDWLIKLLVVTTIVAAWH
jgi:hypothetical protein